MHCSDVVVVSKAAATAKNPNIMMDIRSAAAVLVHRSAPVNVDCENPESNEIQAGECSKAQ